MKYDIATKWVAALRSGDYAQGTGELVTECHDGTPNTYCCLGVLACVMGNPVDSIIGLHVLTEDMKEEARMNDTAGSRADSYELDFGLTPHLDHSYPSLAEANDAGVTFAEIADYIEAHSEEL